jgi:MFS superfamily sulfate permease-like transporter
LFFANVRAFRDEIRRFIAADSPPQRIVIAAEPITDVDTAAADMLEDLDEELNAKGVNLVFTELKEPVRRKLERYELIGPLDPEHFFPTIDAAIVAFRTKTGAEWTASTVKNRGGLA